MGNKETPTDKESRKSDRAILREVVNAVLAQTGGRIGALPALHMLQGLERRYGDDFSIEAACNALDDLSRAAERLKEELRSRRSLGS